jgi:hypothetical protein
MEKKDILERLNILVIAGYDVLADRIRAHQNYVESSFLFGIDVGKADLIFTIGGATNPDYPELTEAEANETIIEDEKRLFPHHPEIMEMSVIALPVGNTSAETLETVREFLEAQEISVDRLVLCAEQSRLAGFLLDALMVGLSDLSDYIIAHGYPFPDSEKDFISQRQKMLMKVMSHYGFPFNFIRNTYQWFHQRKVARIKRKQARARRS